MNLAFLQTWNVSVRAGVRHGAVHNLSFGWVRDVTGTDHSKQDQGNGLDGSQKFHGVPSGKKNTRYKYVHALKMDQILGERPGRHVTIVKQRISSRSDWREDDLTITNRRMLATIHFLAGKNS